ncbi:hypothetical protein NC652_024308 [Populus alba x Populus x berolinensis]|nr:hypothetical protein NC652_024308 [Populus alba x Populus x berolinensis]
MSMTSLSFSFLMGYLRVWERTLSTQNSVTSMLKVYKQAEQYRYSLWNCDLRDLCQTKDVTCGSCAAVKREENDATSDKPYLLLKFTLQCQFVMLGYVGLSEIRGKHLQYSKFLNVGANNANKKQIQVSSRTATLIAYKLSFLASAVSLGLFPNEDLGFLFVESTLTLQFLQPRAIHSLRYSGGWMVESSDSNHSCVCHLCLNT